MVGSVGAAGGPAAPAAAGSAGVVAWPRRASGGRARVGGRKLYCLAGAQVVLARGWQCRAVPDRRGGGGPAPNGRHHSERGAVPCERLQLRSDRRRRKQGRRGKVVVGSLVWWGGDGGGGHLLAARHRRRCRGGGAVGLRQRGLPEMVPIQRHRVQPANGCKEWAHGASGEPALAGQARECSGGSAVWTNRRR